MEHTRELSGTVALVTGASSGIGAATALDLARRGARVVVAARRKERLKDLVADICQAGGTATAVDVDLTDRVQARGLVEGTVADCGRLDIVVNNAGIMLNGRAEDASFDDWTRMVDLNVHAVLAVAHAALPHLLEAAADPAGRGIADLVNISSVAGRVPRAGASVYNLTKHGIGAFSDALRQEVTQRGVRVGLIEPGVVATELAMHLSPAARRAHAERTEGLVLLQADDVADAIAYMVTRPRHVAVNELLIRPADQVA